MSERGRHAVVFETARGIEAFILKKESTRSDADISSHAFGGSQERLALTDGHYLVGVGERQQFVKTPDAAKTEGILTLRPLGLEKIKRLRRLAPIPIVDHVQQAAAGIAGNPRLFDTIGGGARRRDTLLERDVCLRCGGNGPRLLSFSASKYVSGLLT